MTSMHRHQRNVGEGRTTRPLDFFGPRLLYLCVAAGVACLTVSCSGDKRLLDEQNPYYLRGIQLRKQNKYVDAAEAFRKCLRFSWAEASAHLQLGTLCEDHLDDPVQAVVHYRAYLELRPEAENAEMVHRWVERAERACLALLLTKYPEAAIPRREPPPPQPHPEVTAGERERRLASKVKQLNTEILALRRELYIMAAGAVRGPAEPQAAPARPAPPAAPPKEPDAPPPPHVAVYVVKPGDTLSKVSRELYGSAEWWPKLRDYNRELLKGGDRLAPGMRLATPRKEQLAAWARLQ